MGQSPFSYASRISQFGNRSFCGLNEAHVRERYTCILHCNLCYSGEWSFKTHCREIFKNGD